MAAPDAPGRVARSLEASSPVSLCILDTGVRASHEAIRPYFAGGKDFVAEDDDAADEHGHGTQVVGRAAEAFAAGFGPDAPAVLRVYVARVADAQGRFLWSDLVQGLDWCVQQGADVISMSLGDHRDDPAAAAALERAAASGAVLVAAAGNDGPCEDCIQSPARAPHVIAVGCVDVVGALCAISSAGDELDVVAPGRSVEAPAFFSDAARGRTTGSSMAAPFVAAALALILSQDPGLAPTEAEARLLAQAQDLGVAGWDPQFGAGLARIG